MLAILIAHAIATAVAPLLVARWGRRAFYPLALVPLGSLLWVATHWPSGNGDQTLSITWVPQLSMDIDLRFDTLSAVMAVLVLAVGALVLFYCAEYFHHHDGHTEKRLPSFAAELVAFSGVMFGLVVSDNMLVLYVFWELTSVLSFLLVGHYAERATSRRAATQALMVTTLGGLAMLVGIVILGQYGGTYLLSELVARAAGHGLSGTAIDVALVLVLIGALSKSAIVPMHFWLPGAMAAPTPVSAYLHAAAMVKAGVYLVARMTPGFADAAPWRPMIVVLGLATMLLAGWRAVREYDLKLILAFGTVSQLGLITLLVGIGGSPGWVTGCRRCSSSLRPPRRAWPRCRPSWASWPRRLISRRCCTVRRWERGRRGYSPVWSADRCSPPSTACGFCGERSGARDYAVPAPGCSDCTPRPRVSWWHPRCWPAQVWCSV